MVKKLWYRKYLKFPQMQRYSINSKSNLADVCYNCIWKWTTVSSKVGLFELFFDLSMHSSFPLKKKTKQIIKYFFTDKPTNQCSSETSRIQKRRGINLNEDCGLDLVFLFDASVSVDKFYFQTSLAFARELLTIIGTSKRY